MNIRFVKHRFDVTEAMEALNNAERLGVARVRHDSSSSGYSSRVIQCKLKGLSRRTVLSATIKHYGLYSPFGGIITVGFHRSFYRWSIQDGETVAEPHEKGLAELSVLVDELNEACRKVELANLRKRCEQLSGEPCGKDAATPQKP